MRSFKYFFNRCFYQIGLLSLQCLANEIFVLEISKLDKTVLYTIFVCSQNENRALRLKESASLALSAANSGNYVDPDGTAIVMSSELLPAPTPDPRVTWNYFDEQG